MTQPSEQSSLIPGPTDCGREQLTYFSMSRSCMYRFLKPLYLNTLPLKNQPGFLAVTQDFDPFFIGMGNTRESAMYDWKVKFHGKFQIFESEGPKSDKEQALYDLIQDSIDMTFYQRNRTTLRHVTGKIVACRDGNRIPCAYRFDGNPELYQVPEYHLVDKTFMALKKGDRFNALFEYNLDSYQLVNILFGEAIKNEESED